MFIIPPPAGTEKLSTYIEIDTEDEISAENTPGSLRGSQTSGDEYIAITPKYDTYVI